MEEALIGAGASLLGVVLGWWLTKRTSADERAWAERQSVRERQDAAAAALDAGVIEAMKVTPQGDTERREALDRLAEGHVLLRGAWSRATVLTDPAISERVNALDLALVVAHDHTRFATVDRVNCWPLAVAFRDVRKALAAYQRHEPPPPPEFPSPGELLTLAHSAEAVGSLEPVRVELMRRGVM